MAKVELKQPVVEEISNLLKEAKSAVIVDYRGLTVEQDTEPVSYTHLDVYKRQRFWLRLPASRLDGIGFPPA